MPRTMKFTPLRTPRGIRALLLAFLPTVGLGACAGVHGPSAYPLIPAPAHILAGKSDFQVRPETPIVLADTADAEMRRLADFWAAPVRAATGFPLPVVGASGVVGGTEEAVAAEVPSIRLALETAGPREGYHLIIAPQEISLTAADHAGISYGLQTLTQLLPSDLEEKGSPRRSIKKLKIPAGVIDDAPRFPYRGMHLDVGRHFFGPTFVMRYIDLLARYKINRFHWHLTEDQGWRIEIKRYPKLTRVGAWRAQTQVGREREPFRGDGQRYGGYYTQDEIREIVAYAQERYVTIIPEIEMPGHSLAALAAYPELACTEGPFQVGERWGVYEDIYCPKEETFEFLKNVLLEVMDLFPGEYIHIGGDEAPKKRWEESSVAQEVMRREGLADEDELQSWFIHRIETFLNEHGRRLIGWDEILDGGLAPDATVMSWRGTQGGIEAARQGHDVIMTPYSHLYFDYYQGDPEKEPLAIGGYLPLDSVYSFEPIPEELTPGEARHILGAQANVWTEYMKTEDQVEYMVFPRLFALAEVVWTPEKNKDLHAFRRRLKWHLRRLKAMGVNFRPPD
ncbi:MAG: beta-N-acetylhexosaminidase [Gemmatimonadota bacterium]